MQQSAHAPRLARSFTFPVFCPAHPTADLEVLATEAPDEHSAVSRVHVRCTACELVWTYTATCSPTKDHTAKRLGVSSRHRPMKIPRVEVA